jgi:manganese transport protein
MPKTTRSTAEVALDRVPARTAQPRLVLLLGPALVAGVAYLDPGNVASNMSAGAAYGYLLVWVIVAANLTAWLVQYLSAKLGVVTGASLPEVLGSRIRSPWGRRAYWLQAEVVAMATDIAEVIGGAVALHLLFGLPLVLGGAITGAISLGVLIVHSRGGARRFELTIAAFLVVIVVGFSAGVLIAPPDAAGVLGGLVPRFQGTDSVLLAASILGATVMPHAIYAHSALTRDRFHGTPTTSLPRRASTLTDAATRRILVATRWDVSIAMIVAGSVNLVMLLIAAVTLPGAAGTDTLEGAYTAIRDSLGPIIAVLFAVGLLASGLASTSVGAYAGSEIMHGLLRVRVPLVARRIVTLVPALAILGAGVDPTWALVLSQVVLSFGIPFAIVPLVWLTSRRSVLGTHRNRGVTIALGAVASVLLVALNAVLLVLVATGAG